MSDHTGEWLLRGITATAGCVVLGFSLLSASEPTVRVAQLLTGAALIIAAGVLIG